ncbi:Odorant receptor 22c [Carabus blaptoides fortunei]
MVLVVENVLVVISYLQGIATLVACYLKPDELDDMLNMILYDFWTTESVDPVVEKEILKIYKISWLAAKVYQYSIISCFLYMLVSIVNGNFAWDIWVPFDKESLKTFPYYEIVVAIQLITECVSVYFAIVPFNMFFVINLGLVCGQFRLLKEEFNYIGKNTDYNVVTKCVKQHNLILLFLEKLKSVYTTPILIIFAIELILITLSVYVTLTNNMESGSYRFIVVVAAGTALMFVFSFCGQVIKDESFSVSLAIYNSDWENCDPATIRSIINIMCRAQREVLITAGGFHALSLEGFVNKGPITVDLMLKPFLNHWNCIGITPRNRSNGEKFLFLISLILALLFCLSSTLNILFTTNLSMVLVVENVLVVISYLQEVTTLVACYLKSDELDDMLNMILYDFWTTKSVNPVVEKEILKIYKISWLAAKVYKYSIISCFLYMLVSIVNGNFAWDIWVPFDKESLKTFPYYEIVVAIQLITECVSVYFVIIPFNMFFVIILGLVCGQFRLLKEEFNNIGKNTDYNVVTKCVKQHNLILLFLEKLKSVYTTPILIIFAIELILITLSVYVTLTSNME